MYCTVSSHSVTVEMSSMVSGNDGKVQTSSYTPTSLRPICLGTSENRCITSFRSFRCAHICLIQLEQTHKFTVIGKPNKCRPNCVCVARRLRSLPHVKIVLSNVFHCFAVVCERLRGVYLCTCSIIGEILGLSICLALNTHAATAAYSNTGIRERTHTHTPTM